jgi:hypothetical protein
VTRINCVKRLWIALVVTGLNGFPQTTLIHSSIRYVSKRGSDSNDGSSWSRAKLTVAAAVNSLPYSKGENVAAHHEGVVNVGPGVFVEAATPIEWNQHLTIEGSGSTDDGTNSGTIIKLAPGRNTHLFSYTEFSASRSPTGESLQMRNLSLDGNAGSNRAGTGDLVRQIGAQRSIFKNVLFQNASRYGLYEDGMAGTIALYSCTFSDDQAGAIYWREVQGGSMLTAIDTQIDNSGPDAVTIEETRADKAPGSSFVFINLKTENTKSKSTHTHILDLKGRRQAGSAPVSISVLGGYGINTASQGVSFAFEENSNDGPAAQWILQNVSGSYPKVLSSTKSRSNNEFQHAGNVHFEGPNGTSIWYGTHDPNGTVQANPGAIWIQLNGGSGRTLWVKEKGIGTKDGWAPK